MDIGQPLAEKVGIPGLKVQGRPETFGLPVLHINGTGVSMEHSCNCPLDQREFV